MPNNEDNDETRRLLEPRHYQSNGQTQDQPEPSHPGIQLTKTHLLGGALAISASLVFTANNYFIKKLKVDFADVLFLRSFVQLLIFSTYMKFFKTQPLWPDFSSEQSRFKRIVKRLLLFVQGIAVGLVVLCIFLSVQAIPLGDALTLVFSSPLFTMILSAIVLKSRMGLYKIMFCIILIIGIVLVVRPPFLFPPDPNPTSYNESSYDHHEIQHHKHDSQYFLGVLAGISGAICGSVVTVLVNFLKDVDFNYLIIYAGIGGLFDSLISASVDDNCLIFRDPSSANWSGLCLIVFLGISANLMAIKAYQLISPPVASILRSQEIVFAYVLQAVAMNVIPSNLSILGAGLVILSAICVPLEPLIVPRLPGHWTQRIM